MESNINKLLYDLVNDPYNPTINLKLGYKYETDNQTASALSYYLRSAEFSSDPNISYESLIRIGLCLGKAVKRGYSEKGAFLNATQCIPNRPEAYFYLSQYEEYRKNWQESYLYANIGHELCDYTYPDLILPHTFPGKLGTLFQKALCSWWIGLCDESRELFQKMLSEF